MKTTKTLLLLTCVFVFGCSESANKPTSTQMVDDTQLQDSIFKQLISLTGNGIPKESWNDSLAFLVLPLQASCPSCRKKTIDSILKHQDNLLTNRFIIVSASGGKKMIKSYFLEEGQELPDLENKLFLDSTNQAFKYDLFKDNPTFYYTVNQKAYKRVFAIPATVRDDLREFFSGYRMSK